MPEVRLLIICHAEGLQNRYSDLQQDSRSQADGGLTAFGWEQTNLLAQWLMSHEIVDALYAAPLLRSRLTAQRLGQSLNLPVTVCDGLPGRFLPRPPPLDLAQACRSSPREFSSARGL